MATLTAVNPKYQRALNKAYEAARKYHEAVNVDDNGKRQEREWHKFEELRDELPKREQAALQRFHKATHGYEA